MFPDISYPPFRRFIPLLYYIRQKIKYERFDILSLEVVSYNRNKKKEAFYMENALTLDKRTQNLVENCLLSDDILSDLTYFFTIFSDKTRLKLLSALAISRMCVTDLAGILSLNQTTVSHQLRLLKNLGAVDYERNGKVITYFLKDELIGDVLLKGMEFLGS